MRRSSQSGGAELPRRERYGMPVPAVRVGEAVETRPRLSPVLLQAVEQIQSCPALLCRDASSLSGSAVREPPRRPGLVRLCSRDRRDASRP
jgi:hypothetical protein